MRRYLLAFAAFVAAVLLGASSVEASPSDPCEDGARIVVRYNRSFPCNPDGDNRLDFTWGHNWGADQVQDLCADMGGRYQRGPRLKWCYDVDI